MPSNDNINHGQVGRVLVGASSYDALSEQQQAIVRRRWAKRMEVRRESLNYAELFTTAGWSYSEADESGNVIVHPARG